MRKSQYYRMYSLNKELLEIRALLAHSAKMKKASSRQDHAAGGEVFLYFLYSNESAGERKKRFSKIHKVFCENPLTSAKMRVKIKNCTNMGTVRLFCKNSIPHSCEKGKSKMRERNNSPGRITLRAFQNNEME